MKIDQDLVAACAKLVKSIDAAKQRHEDEKKDQLKRAQLRQKYYGKGSSFIHVFIKKEE